MLYIILISLAFLLIFLFIVFIRLKKPVAELNNDSFSEKPFEILEIQISKHDEEKDVQFPSLSAENMFSALHGLLKDDASIQEKVSLEMISSGDSGIRFYVTAPSGIIKFLESQIYAQNSSAQISIVEDYTGSVDPKNSKFCIAAMDLERKDFFPIKTFRDLEIDPLSSISSAVTELKTGEEIWFQLVISPVADVWQEEGFKYVEALQEGNDPNKASSLVGTLLSAFTKEATEIASGAVTGMFTYRDPQEEAKKKEKEPQKRLTSSEEAEIKAIENKLARMGFEVNYRILSSAADEVRADSNLRSAIASLKQFTTLSLNRFSSKIDKNNIQSLEDYKNRSFNEDNSFILCTEELATIYHFPSSGISTPNISWVFSRKSEPPSNLPVDGCVYIGHTLYRNKKVRFGLKNEDDRLRHMYVIGKSGTGKSTLFNSMMTQDIANGAGVGILDPHGETIEQIIQRIPDNRIDDVIYFDPSDTENPVGLNLLELDNPSQKNLMASGLVAAIRENFEYSWGPRLEYLLNYAILTLLDVPGTTLLGITRLLEDKNYRNFILHQVKDPVVQRFWDTEYKNLSGNQKFVTEAIAPIQNKVNRFLASSTIRNILGQAKSTLDIADALNNGKILLMNLSKGKIGADNANLLGALLVSRIQFYALQRANIPYEERKPFYLYVDEFQNFATGSFEEILSESRKYKLGLYLTHQFTAQLPEELQKAVFGNVGTIISFSIGAPDAKVLENEFVPYFGADDLITLERFQIYLKLMIDGMTSLPFSARILVPWEGDFMYPITGNKQKVIERSRSKYGADRQRVEDKIGKWIETPFDKGFAIAQEYKGVEKKGDDASN